MLKRPLFCVSVSFVAGMYILSLVDVGSVLIFGVLLILLLLIMLLRKFSIKRVALLLLCTLVFGLGCVRYSTADEIKAKDLYTKIGKEITLKTEITEEPIVSENGISFVGNVITVTDGDETSKSDEKVKFTYYSKGEDVTESAIPKLGDLVVVPGKIKIPNGPMNTGGFDYARYLKTDKIFFICDVEYSELTLVGHTYRPFEHTLAKFRKRCMGFFDDVFPEEEASVLKAFVVGDKSSVGGDIRDDFSASGLSHILAVSGLHVTTFIGIVGTLLRVLHTSKRKKMFISSLCAVAFVLFTGASVSAIRAGVLCVAGFGGKLLYRKSDSLTTLSVAAAGIALVNPHCIYDASFMLSFAATAGIILFSAGMLAPFDKFYKKFEYYTFKHRIIKGFFEVLSVGIAAQVFVIPILVYIFRGFSTMSVIATVVVSPFLNGLLCGGILFILLSFINSTVAYPAAGFTFLLAKILIAVAEFFANLKFSNVIFGVITPFLLLMYALFIVVFVSIVKKKKVAYVISLISFTVLSTVGLWNFYGNYDTLQVSFINVGQGDCALVKTPGDCDVLIDAGGYSGSDSGEYIIEPYLISNGVSDLEYVIISHTDIDHIVGISGLINNMPIENIVIPYGQQHTQLGNALVKTASEKGINILYFTHGDKLKINDDIILTAILPDSGQFMYSKSENDTGIVLRLDYGKSSFLFTGDISSDIEKYAIKNYPELLKADVLKVAHHGSKYSSCEEFLSAVDAEYAYIPVGKNTYGHPAPEVIERIEKSGIHVYRADFHKDVTFYANSDGIKGVKYNKKIAEE